MEVRTGNNGSAASPCGLSLELWLPRARCRRRAALAVDEARAVDGGVVCGGAATEPSPPATPRPRRSSTDGSCPRSALRPRARDSSACASPVLPLIFFSDSRQKCMQRARTSLINSQNMPTSVLNSPVGGTDSSVFVPVHASSSCPEPASAALLSPLSLSATNNTPRMQGAQQFGSMLTNSGSLGLYGTPMYTRYIHCKHLSRVGIHRRFVYR